MSESGVEEYRQMKDAKYASYLNDRNNQILGSRIIDSYMSPMTSVALINAMPAAIRDAQKQRHDTLEKKAYTAMNNPEIEKDFRELLSELSARERVDQNLLFSSLIDRYPDSSQFIIKMLNPDIAYNNAAPSIALAKSAGLGPDHFDFVERILEKDKNGVYAIDDERAHNIVQWYNSAMVMRQGEFRKEALEYERNYVTELRNQIKVGALPEVFNEAARYLEIESGEYVYPAYHLIDTSNTDKTGSYFRDPGAIYDGSEDSEINISILIARKKEYVERTLSHEYTHAIAGDIIEFGSNKKAQKIINEALTESISNIIQFGEQSFGSGNSYQAERQVLKLLQSKGTQVIPPEIFYEAYGERDYGRAELIKKIRNVDFVSMDDDETISHEDIIKVKEGDNHRKLKDLLLSNFPECKNDEDLGEMIVKIYKELINNANSVKTISNIFNKKTQYGQKPGNQQ